MHFKCIALTLVVFAIPLLTFVPGFTLWEIIPKIRVTRLHIFSKIFSWFGISIFLMLFLGMLFVFFIELRKRSINELVESVLSINRATEGTIAVVHQHHTEAARACVDALDACAEHYEHLVMLRQELRQRTNKQHPPVAELSSSELQNIEMHQE